jgi:hypothetical protein
MNHFRMNQRVVMTKDALENYGKKYRGTVFTICVISKSEKDHPGYDNGVAPDWLYDLKLPDGEYFGSSLYDCELRSF